MAVAQDVGADLLDAPVWATPNALAILVALAAVNEHQANENKTDDIGWMCRQNAPWVLRHGRILEEHGLARFITNGHTDITDEGKAFANQLLRAKAPVFEQRSDQIKVQQAGCRILTMSGEVYQYVPTALPGHKPLELNPRSRRAHHEGVWIRARYHYGYGAGEKVKRLAAGVPLPSADGVGLRRGMMVDVGSAAPGFGSKRFEGAEIVATGGDFSLVKVPCVSDCLMIRNALLLSPGAPDWTPLTEHQATVAKAIIKGQVLFSVDQDDTIECRLDGRKVLSTTMTILERHGFIDRDRILAENLTRKPGA